MNCERLIKVLEIYEAINDDGKCPPIRIFNGGTETEHISWMILETKKLANEGRIEKANRWLGFIQGAMWVKGMYTIDDFIEHNRPSGY